MDRALRGVVPRLLAAKRAGDDARGRHPDGASRHVVPLRVQTATYRGYSPAGGWSRFGARTFEGARQRRWHRLICIP